MTSINDKMGRKRAEERRMMHLPRNRAAAAAITAATCPTCHHTGARASKTKGPGWLYCSWCNTVWELVVDPTS